MQEYAEAEAEVRKLMLQDMSAAKIDRIKVRDGSDSDGAPSLFVRVILQNAPPRGEFRKISLVVDQFRSWLIAKKSDERFPYFEFSTTADERDAD